MHRRCAAYCGRIKLHIVPFTEVQEAIRDQCPEDLLHHHHAPVYDEDCLSVVARAQRAVKRLITGESVGTGCQPDPLGNLGCTDVACDTAGAASGDRHGQG